MNIDKISCQSKSVEAVLVRLYPAQHLTESLCL